MFGGNESFEITNDTIVTDPGIGGVHRAIHSGSTFFLSNRIERYYVFAGKETRNFLPGEARR